MGFFSSVPCAKAAFAELPELLLEGDQLVLGGR
jgi:hypothetical protein